MTSDRLPNSDFRLLEDCKQLFFKILNLTKQFDEYKYTLNQHTLRTTISIGSNLAEGNKKSKKDFLRFINISEGSIAELEFQLSLYNCEDDELLDLIDKIKACIYKLKIGIRKSDVGGRQ